MSRFCPNCEKLHERRTILCSRCYYIKNRIKIIQSVRAYAQRNPEKINIAAKVWRDANPEKVKLSNRMSHQKYRKEYNLLQQKLKQTNMNYRIRCTLTSRMWHAIKHGKGKKDRSTVELLGCSIPFYRQYLARLFDDEMSWENYGQWHIDHIKPCASFDLTDCNQMLQCFHYTNTQPLWASANASKGKRY